MVTVPAVIDIEDVPNNEPVIPELALIIDAVKFPLTYKVVNVPREVILVCAGVVTVPAVVADVAVVAQEEVPVRFPLIEPVNDAVTPAKVTWFAVPTFWSIVYAEIFVAVVAVPANSDLDDEIA